MNWIGIALEAYQWIVVIATFAGLISVIWMYGDEIEDFRSRIKELERRTYGDGK
jgi:predicted SpoU family rRNA methylase